MDANLLDAQCLATFSNLSPGDLEKFRNSVCPDFLPDSFWDSLTITSSALEVPWQLLQQAVREAWEERFPLDRSIQLITWIDKHAKLTQALERAVSNQEILNMKVPEHEVWPFERAVMFMAVNSWRARFCLRCGKRFVAAKPKSTYCSDDCRKESLKSVKRTWWSEHGQNWRKGKQKNVKKQTKKGRR